MTRKPATVTELLEALAASVPDKPVSATGVLQSWRVGSTWSRCELVTYEGPEVVARIVVAIPPGTSIQAPERSLEGTTAIVDGRFQVHPLYGPVQLTAQHIRVTATESPSEAAAHTRLDRLRAAGLIDRNQSLQLSSRPCRIGLITPMGGGAGGTDFLHRLEDSGERIDVITRPVPMGGPLASRAIPAAVVEMCADVVDAIVICRGGGSASDLSTFNHPAVIEAICMATRPVIMAVGHTTDTTFADRVAHTSLHTPSAAASWLIDLHRSAERQAAIDRAKTESAAASAARRSATAAERAALDLAEHAGSQARRAKLVLHCAVALAVFVVAALLILRML